MILEHNFIKPERVGDDYRISFWKRSYTTGNGGAIFSSITANGKELLARPATINVYSGGERCVFGKAITKLMANCPEDEKTVVSAFESEVVVVNVCHRFEEDSCNDMTISVMPRGRSVAASFGLAPVKLDAFDVDRIHIDFPLRKDALPFFQTFPAGRLLLNTPDGEPANLDYAGLIPKGGFHSIFKEQVYIGGEDCGLGVFFSDNKVWKNKELTRAVELIEEEDCYLLRFNIIDEAPAMWLDKGEDDQFAIDLQPLKIKLGTILTPLKPYPKDSFYRRALTIDAWRKVYCNYDEFLSGKKNADNTVNEAVSENRFDRLSRFGVKTLHIHEKWNDIQNSPLLTEDTANRLKYIVDECHARNIKLIPYFGYEISTLSPIFAEKGERIMRKESPQCRYAWYRYPYQRALNVCMESEWADILYEGVAKLYDQYGFDGVYFDTLGAPRACENELHGCGYRDENGQLHPTYPVWGIRRFLKKMYPFVKTRGGQLHLHMFGAFNLAALSFCDFYAEGETFQSKLMRGLVTEMPEPLLCAQFTGVDTGVPVESIVYINEPTWTYRNALASALLFGSIPVPNDIDEPLELMSRLWDVLDSFPIANSVWKPYYHGTESIRSSEDSVKISSWETEAEILAVCATTTSGFDGEVEITAPDFPMIKNAYTDEPLTENGRLTLKFKGFDFVILRAKKK